MGDDGRGDHLCGGSRDGLAGRVSGEKGIVDDGVVRVGVVDARRW